jgi:hypothetical protein
LGIETKVFLGQQLVLTFGIQDDHETKLKCQNLDKSDVIFLKYLNFISAIKFLKHDIWFFWAKYFEISLINLYILKLKDITNFNVIMKLKNELN